VIRALVLAAWLLPRTVLADDGYYMEVSAGPVSYLGELAAYAGDTGKVHVAFSARFAAWTFELTMGGLLNDGPARCGRGVQCRVIEEPGPVELDVFGTNVRHRWRLVGTRWSRFGLATSVYGGVRRYWGEAALDEYAGFGIGGGARIELDVWAFGYFLDVGGDAMRLTSVDGSVLHGTTPYFLLGAKLGWL
jgi:hypothetical protein